MAISKELWEQAKEQALENNKQLDSVQILKNVFKEIYSHFDFSDQNINSDDENNFQADEDENTIPEELDEYEDYIPNPDSAYEDNFENLD